MINLTKIHGKECKQQKVFEKLNKLLSLTNNIYNEKNNAVFLYI